MDNVISIAEAPRLRRKRALKWLAMTERERRIAKSLDKINETCDKLKGQ
jgi:hypothetical protein